jgi:predicted dithiol-disulfide oxidoreductase (DUF899 family)
MSLPDVVSREQRVTYSTYARGTDQLGSSYTLLDLTVLGRMEDWEEPKGRMSRSHGADPSFTD